MVAIIFCPSRRPPLAYHPPPPVSIFPLLPDPPSPTNVQTSFMDGPK